MHWADAVPNLVIGLREGLEAGLIVTILLAAVRKLAKGGDAVTAPIWWGTAGAASVSVGFAAVLTFTTATLSGTGRAAVAGALSVVAVGLVTAMIFWMRRTASSLSAQLRGDAERALALGAGALALTAFAAVAREGLETTLFLWTAVKAAGETGAPLIGAGLGLAVAFGLCWLLYRRAIRLNLGLFFSRTAGLLIVIAAGVLAYGLGDLQIARVLPGSSWVAFDVSHDISPTSWWITVLSGLTNLTPRMTVLQVTAWAGYLVVVALLLHRPGTATAATPPRPSTSPLFRAANARPRATVSLLIATPLLVAALLAGLLPPAEVASTVTVTDKACAPEWTSGTTGTHSFAVTNKSGVAGEILLLTEESGIVGEIETLGPGTTADLPATLGAGSYRFQCLMASGATTSRVVAFSGSATPTDAVRPASIEELTPATDAYVAYVKQRVAAVIADVKQLRQAIATGSPTAEAKWLQAQLDWELVGASYNSFGDLGVAVDGLPGGLPGGTADPGFTGLHRIEWDLFHGASTATLVADVDHLLASLGEVAANAASEEVAGDPMNLRLRGHEIVEDAQRDHLRGVDDLGSGAAYALTWADSQATRAVLGFLKDPIESRDSSLLPTAIAALDRLEADLLATRDGGVWTPRGLVAGNQQALINADLAQALEVLAKIPGLLEVPIQRTDPGSR